MNFALTGNQVDSGSYRLGGEFGIDMIKTFESGVELGGAVDAGMFMVKEYQSINDDAGMMVDFLARVGYNFNNSFGVPLSLRTGAGYAVGQIGSHTMDGFIYDVAAEYDFSNKYGFGVKYKQADLTLTLSNNPKMDYSQAGCYLSVKF